MKNSLKIFPIIICFLLMAAHLSRANLNILMVVCLVLPFILLWKSKVSARVVQIALMIFGLEWIRALIYYAHVRMENGEDWFRLGIILIVVAVFNFVTIFVYRSSYMIDRYNLR